MSDVLKLAAKKGYADARRAHQIRKLILFNAGPNLLCNPSSAARQTMKLVFGKLGTLPVPYAMVNLQIYSCASLRLLPATKFSSSTIRYKFRC